MPSFGKQLLGLAAGVSMGLVAALLLAMLTPAGSHGVFHAISLVVSKPRLLEQTVLLSAPIAASAIGLVPAYRARFITIGSEGQVLLGAVVALGVTAYYWKGYDPLLVISVALVLAAVAGAVLGVVVGLLRLVGVNEVLSSLMLNYVVMYLVNYLVSGPWREGAFTLTRSVPNEYRLGPATILAILVGMALVYELLLRRTSLGYAIEAYGSAPRAAVTYGVSWRMVVLFVSILSGMAAGVGGAMMMLGFQYSFTALSAPPGYGYMGILVSWISLLDPLISVGMSLLFAGIGVTVRLLQASGVSFGFTLALQAVIVLATTTTTMLLARKR